MCSHGLNIHLYKHFEAEEGEGMCFAVLENVGKSSRLGGGRRNMFLKVERVFGGSVPKISAEAMFRLAV